MVREKDAFSTFIQSPVGLVPLLFTTISVSSSQPVTNQDQRTCLSLTPRARDPRIFDL